MKKFLASVLSVLMLVSCMSFVVNAQDAATVTITFNTRNGVAATSTTFTVGTDTNVTFPADPTFKWRTFKGWSTEKDGAVLEGDVALPATDTTYYAIYEHSADWPEPLHVMKVEKNFGQMNVGGGSRGDKKDSVYYWDAVSDVVFANFYPGTPGQAPSCNMYSGLGFTTDAPNLYIVSYFRTDILGGNQFVGMYGNSNKDGTGKAVTANPTDSVAIAAEEGKWYKHVMTIPGTSEVAAINHIDFSIVGGKGGYSSSNYVHVAGVAFVEDADDAANFDVSTFGYTGDATIKFDAHLTEDDDTDVFDEYPANLENDGNALVGWTLDPTAEVIEYVDLTKLPYPEADTTYHAVWNAERTINFYKNDGTDAVETLVLGKGAALTAPEFAIDGKTFLGWTDADGNPVEIQETAEENADYYASWATLWLTKIVVNGNDKTGDATSGRRYGIANLVTATSLDIVMPYGYSPDCMPTLELTSNAGTAVFNAPTSFDDEGEVVITNGDDTRSIPVTFSVADRSTVSDLTIVPTSVSDDGKGNVGTKAIVNNTEKGISATKFVPIYSEESEYYQASNDSGKNGLLPTKGTGLQGYGLFRGDYEPYSQLRFFLYYDAGEDNEIDKNANSLVKVLYTNAHTRGTVANRTFSQSSGVVEKNRWQYVYINLPEYSGDTYLYGYTEQLVFDVFGGGLGNSLKDDVVYLAGIDMLVDPDEKYLQYKPTELSSTNETSAKNDGTLSGVNSDMEISIDGGDYAAITTFEGFDAETGVLSGLAPATYTVRYAATETHAESEAVELTITPDSVEIYFEDGDDSTSPVEKIFAYQEVVTPAEDPSKAGFTFAGWALGDATDAYDFTDVTANADLDGVTFNALWEKVTEFYVNGSATTNGDGLTAETPMNSITNAWNAIGEYDGTIYITGVTKLQGTIKGHGGDITVTAANDDAYLTWNGATFQRGEGGTIIFEDITLKYSGGNGWTFMNFAGLNYEFGEGFSNPTGTIDEVAYHTLKVRSGGEEGVNYTVDDTKYIPVAEKVVIRGGAFGSVYLGGKGAAQIEDIYAEYYGGTGDIAVGNDSSGANKGVLGNARILLEAAPKSVSVGNNSTAMTGAFEFIANNGVTTTPSFSVEPAGGKYLVYSAEGGRVDFTETKGTYKVTTDKVYAVITDAEGVATKYRMADGAHGDAELYAETKSLDLVLEAGTYNVTYTDEGVSVKGTFKDESMAQPFELNADNNYTAQAGEDMINRLKDAATAGYKFSGEFASRDGKYTTVNGAITVTEYTDEYIELFPVFVEDDSVAYYHATGVYNDVAGTYNVTVSIANGKFVAGTVGLTNLNAEALEFTGVTMSDDAANNLGSAAAIVSEAPEGTKVVVWNAAEGSIDATNGDVALMTFNFKILDATAFETGKPVVEFYRPQTSYEDYYEDGYYQASPVNAEGEDEFAVNFVDVYLGKIEFEKAATDPATITVTVTMPDKTGATVDNIAYLAYFKDYSDVKFIAIEEAGNTEKTTTVTLTDIFYVGETYTFTVVKNGYTGSEEKEITIEDGMVLETTILGGDIKESFTGEDANAVDLSDFGDGDVTLADFVRVVRAFDENATEEFKAAVDINEDGAVNVTDIGIVKANYGKSFEDVELAVSTND